MATISAGAGPSGRKALSPSIPLTPFLDLLLCCLMFLLVTAVWNQLGSMQTSQRAPGRPSAIERDAPRVRLFLTVHADGYELSSNIGDRQHFARSESDSVDEALRARKQLSGPDPSMTVCADDGVAYQELVWAMDHALAAGFVALDVGDSAQL